MALTRKLMKSMGIEDEKIDQIIEAHVETVDALKSERDGYKAEADRLASVEGELQALKEKPGDDFREKFEAEHEAFEAYKSEVAAKEAEREKVGLYESVLRDAGIDEKRIASVVKVTDLSALEVKDGEIVDREKAVESAKSEWGDFIVQSSVKGAQVDTPPAKTATEKEPGSLAEAIRQKMFD